MTQQFLNDFRVLAVSVQDGAERMTKSCVFWLRYGDGLTYYITLGGCPTGVLRPYVKPPPNSAFNLTRN